MRSTSVATLICLLGVAGCYVAPAAEAPPTAQTTATSAPPPPSTVTVTTSAPPQAQTVAFSEVASEAPAGASSGAAHRATRPGRGVDRWPLEMERPNGHGARVTGSSLRPRTKSTPQVRGSETESSGAGALVCGRRD